MGEHQRAGEGNSLGFTDMTTKNLNSSAPARLFPKLSNWQMNAELGELVSKTQAGSGSGVHGDGLLAAKTPGPGEDGRAPGEDAPDGFYLISGTHRGRLCPSPLPGAPLYCSPLQPHRRSLLAAQ